MIPALIAGGLVSNIIGGIAGKDAGAGDAGKANDAANIAFEKLNSLGLPPDQSRAIIFEQFKQKGMLTPELEQHIEQQSSRMSQIEEDPNLKDSQMQALQMLKERGRGGLNPEDRAALNQMRQQVATDAEAKRQQILQNFAARGQGGSGAELISALQASQAGANEASAQGDRLAAMASQNALQAIGQAGTLGGQIRGQEFGQKAQQASAEDVINQFNTANSIGQQARNVGAQNQAQQYNLGVGQQIDNANVQQGNQELLRQNDAKRQYYKDLENRAQIQAGGARQYSNDLQASSARQASSAAAPYSAIGASLLSAGTSMGGSSKPKTTNQYDNIFEASNGGEVPSNEELSQEDMLPVDSMINQRSQQNREIIQRWKAKHNASDQDAQNMLQELQTKDVNFWQNEPTPPTNPGYADGGEVKPEDNSLNALMNRVLGARKANPAPTPDLPAVRSAQDSMRKAFNYSHGGPVSSTNHQRRNAVTDYRDGGHVPGQEEVPGDSPKNDTVPAMLSPGEFVIPKTTAKSEFGKKLIKLLESHHEVMKHSKD